MRLAMDILNSIRLRYYTYYSVNLLHGHEDALSSSLPPFEAHEVLALKLQGIQGSKGAPTATSNPMADAVTTFNLMMRVVESYNMVIR